MNTGIQDAVALAARLTAVLQDGAADTELDEYEAERRPVASQVVAMTDRITRIAAIDSVPLRKARNTLLRALDWVPSVNHSLAMRLAELTESTLTRADRQLAAALLRGSGDHTRQLAVAVRRLSSVRGPGSGRITDHEGGHRGVAGIRP